MKVTSSFAPPMLGMPASLASGMFASSGCGLLMMSTATSIAALLAAPAAAALPVSGNSTPTLTGSAARAIRALAARLAAVALAPARTVRRLIESFVICGILPAALLGGHFIARRCADLAQRIGFRTPQN